MKFFDRLAAEWHAFFILVKTSATIVPYAHFWFASMRTGVSPQSDAYFSRLPMHVNPRGMKKSISSKVFECWQKQAFPAKLEVRTSVSPQRGAKIGRPGMKTRRPINLRAPRDPKNGVALVELSWNPNILVSRL